MYYFTQYESPFGYLTLASNGRAVSGAWYETHRYMCQSLGEKPVRSDDDPVLKQLASWQGSAHGQRRLNAHRKS